MLAQILLLMRFLDELVPTGVNRGHVCPLKPLLREYLHIRRDPPVSEMLSILPKLAS
jgi:hypothetical protein